MLRDLTIQNYRAFENFAIDRLARVNLLVGANNSGKTSFLEAIYLLVSQGVPSILLELLDNRGEFVTVVEPQPAFNYQTAHIFHGHLPRFDSDQTSSPKVIAIRSRKDTTLAVRIWVSPLQNGLPTVGNAMGGKVSQFDILFEYRTDTGQPQVALRGDGEYFHTASNRFLSARQPSRHHHLLPSGAVDFAYLSALWDGVTLSPEKEHNVVRALQILEPDVEDIRFTSRPTAGSIFVKLRERQQRVPLSSMGDGMRRILHLAASAVMSENGVLLVDEIDTGLYHGVQTDMWRLLIETAQRLNVQIFATTHSWDCVVAFQEALESTDGSLGSLFRLEAFKGDIRAVRYEHDELAIAVREAIEVR